MYKSSASKSLVFGSVNGKKQGVLYCLNVHFVQHYTVEMHQIFLTVLLAGTLQLKREESLQSS